ncbi:hypothetical protein [Kitasatospora sp. NPDC098663]|uniref:hypothetical protein n=1 Tax=Kitasatospora sp. NPDC098663 TaxID=3364096 RepID=UPI0037F9E873
MPKYNRSQKAAARRRKAATGMSLSAAAGGTGHRHQGPDLTVLKTLPHAAGRPVNTRLAAAVVAACRAGCRPCQASAIPVLVADRPTVAALASAAFDNPLTRLVGPGMFVSEPTRAWWAAAHDAGNDPDRARAGLVLLKAMTETQATELLNDALEYWAAGAHPDDEPDAPGIQVITLDDLGIDPSGPEPEGGIYGVMLQQIVLPGHPPLPMLTLYPETPAAGLEDLRRRTRSPSIRVPTGARTWLPSSPTSG